LDAAFVIPKKNSNKFLRTVSSKGKMGSIEYLSPEGFRIDGRKKNEVFPSL
jgi:hypothetical protein